MNNTEEEAITDRLLQQLDEQQDACSCGGNHLWVFAGESSRGEIWMKCGKCGIGMEA